MQSREQPPRSHLSPDLPTPLGERPLADARIVLSNPRFWWLLLAAVLVTAYAGPYYTVAIFTLAQRLFYWGVIVLLCGIGMTVLSSYALALNRHIGLHWTLAVTVPALLVIYPVAVLCYALGDVMAGRVPNGGLVEMMGYVGAPMVIINLVVGAFVRANWPTGVSAPFAHAPFAQAPGSSPTDAETRGDAPAPAAGLAVAAETAGLPPQAVHSASLAAAPAAEPLIYDKLPPELGRDIVCLRAQDHYVEVTTTRGTALVLMRLGDAERDLSCIDGMRVHRSWWVALDQVESLARTESGSWELTTSCGQKIPVSRGQRETLREALEVRPRPRAAE